MPQAQVDIILSSGQKAGETLKELGKTANKLNKEIRDLKPGTQEFINKAKDLAAVNGQLDNVKKQVKGVGEAGKLMNTAFGQFVPFSGHIRSFSDGFNSLRGGVGGVTKGFGLLKGAIAATGIGLLVLIIASLWQWLQKSQKGMELVSKVTAVFGEVVEVLIGRIGKLIEAFVFIIKGEFKKGFTALGETFKGIGKEIKDSAVEAWNLEAALIALEKAETDLSLKQSQRNRVMAELKLIYDDQTKSYEDRKKALIDASSIEKAGLSDSIRLQEERFRIAKAEFDSSDQNEEKRKKMIEEQIKLEDLRAESAKVMTKLMKEMNELEKKYNDEGIKAWENRKKVVEAINIEHEVINEEARKKELAAAVKQREAETRAAVEKAEERLAFAQRTADEEEFIRQTSTDTAKEGFDTLIGILSMDEQARKKHATAIKALSIGNIWVNLFDEISSIWKFAEANPTNILFPGFGTIIAIAKTVFATGRAAAAISKVGSQKFSLGGILRGASHAAGGILGMIRSTGQPIEMEGDETILTGNVSRSPTGRAAASALNHRYGGIRFATGGPVNPLQPLSSSSRAVDTGAGQGSGTIDSLKPLLERIEARLAAWPQTLQVHNNLQDTRRGLRVLNDLEGRANF